MRSIAILGLALILSACLSTAVQPFVGMTVDEAVIAYGQPENVFPVADGRTAYQFRIGGSGGQTKFTDGCLVTFIARGTVIQESRIPKQLFC